MSIDSMSGFSSAFDQSFWSDTNSLSQNSTMQQSQAYAPMDKQTFGAEVVSKTLDYMNGQASSGMDFAPMDKQTFGAQVVSKTLDYMNAGNSHDNGMAQSYNFQKDVLGAYANSIGALANLKV